MQQVANKKGIVFLVIVSIIVALIFYFRTNRVNQIEKNGIYQIATVVRKEGAKNGTEYSFTFEYRGSTYEADILSSDIDSFFIIKFLPDNPKMWIVAYKRLPPCVTLKDAVHEGWKKLPANCD